MRKWALFVPALVTAACAAVPAPPVIHAESPGQMCNAAGTDPFVGQAATAEVGAAILAATHAALLRWAPPSFMMTMDFRSDRVTVSTGPDGRITKIACG